MGKKKTNETSKQRSRLSRSTLRLGLLLIVILSSLAQLCKCIYQLDTTQDTIPSAFGSFTMPVTEAYVEPEPSPTLSGAASIISTILVDKNACVFGTLFGNGLSGYFNN